jgi:uncharacterized protein
MKIDRYRNELEAFFRDNTEVISGTTLITRARAEMFQIALCYRDDGDLFLRNGDRVNALASFAYASGWIDMGFYLGIFSRGSPCRTLLEKEEFHPDLMDRLREKTIRYSRLLTTASLSCHPSAEPGIAWRDGGERVMVIAGTYLRGGAWFLGEDTFNNALSCFSYGHGWLDAAIRVGLISITSDRELFAI